MPKTTSRLDLFRARFDLWRATPGSPKWHRAAARIRSYYGEQLLAAAHRFLAAIGDWVQDLADRFAKMAASVLGDPDG